MVGRRDVDPRKDRAAVRLDADLKELGLRRLDAEHEAAVVARQPRLGENPTAPVLETHARRLPGRQLVRRPAPVLPVIDEATLVDFLRYLDARGGALRG